MKKKRPINLDLTTLPMPIASIASILHRISGIVLFLLLPVMLYFYSLSTFSENSFTQLQSILSGWMGKIVIWGFLVAFAYHVLAGTRHLLMDFGLGEGPRTGRRTAGFVILLSILIAIVLGVWLC